MPKVTTDVLEKVLDRAKPVRSQAGVTQRSDLSPVPSTVASHPEPTLHKAEPVAEPGDAKRPSSSTKPARKRKSAAEKQDQLIGATCTKAEADLIKAKAQKLGMTPGRYLVDCALKKTAEILKSHELYSEVRLQKLIEFALAASKTTNQPT